MVVNEAQIVKDSTNYTELTRHEGIFIQRIGSLAAFALRVEALAAPKPGLVDRLDSGSHSDMDISMFLTSIDVIEPFLIQMGASGWTGAARGKKVLKHPEVFQQARQVGLHAEQAMFEHTHRVNTHKGAIFSIGLLCTACGYCAGKNFREKKELRYPQASEIIECAGAMVPEIVELEMADRKPFIQAETAGMQLFRLYGITGIRGEAERGFPTLRSTALPILTREYTRSNSIDIQAVQTLLHLITVTEDTNIIARGGLEALDYSRTLAYRALELGGMHKASGREAISRMNKEFISLNISPGGSADLLAAAIFLTSL